MLSLLPCLRRRPGTQYMRRSAPWTCRSPVARTCRTSSTVAVVVHIDAHVRASDPDVSGAYSDIHSKLLQHSAATLAARPVLPCPVHGGPATLLSAPRPRTGTRRWRGSSGRRLSGPREPQSGFAPHLAARRFGVGSPAGFLVGGCRGRGGGRLLGGHAPSDAWTSGRPTSEAGEKWLSPSGRAGRSRAFDVDEHC